MAGVAGAPNVWTYSSGADIAVHAAGNAVAAMRHLGAVSAVARAVIEINVLYIWEQSPAFAAAFLIFKCGPSARDNGAVGLDDRAATDHVTRVANPLPITTFAAWCTGHSRQRPASTTDVRGRGRFAAQRFESVAERPIVGFRKLQDLSHRGGRVAEDLTSVEGAGTTAKESV